MSPKNVICFMYFKSQSSFSSQSMSFLPLTCARPESPGLTLCLLRCVLFINTISLTSCGLGPITLMSPFRILKASGSSSKLVDRSHFPNSDNLASSSNNSPFSSLSSVIVRNLYNLNSFSFLPGLGCVNRTGDPNFTFTNIATMR